MTDNRQPDILLIVLDTLRRDRLSSYGHPLATSPALDRFAEGGTLFDRAISPAQWTVPAHASLFTGLYPTSHQLTQATDQLSPHIPTLAEILSAGGYHTAGFCNNPLVGVLDNGLTRGFDAFYNYAGAAPNRPRDMKRSRPRRALARGWGRFARAASQQFARRDWLFRASLHPLLTPIWTRSINYKGNTAHSIDDMIDVIGTHRAGGRTRPLFGFVNLMGGHLPYHPPHDYLARFAPEISRDKAAHRFMRQFNADAGRWASPVDAPLSAWESAVIDAFYAAEVAHQDYHLGRLLDYLQRSGALDDTLVIITADHGEGHGDHDFFGHSFVVYQELVHVPLVVHQPSRYPAGERIAANISTRRLFHTVLDAANIAPPTPASDDDEPAHRAFSLRRSLNGKPDAETLAFAEAIPPQTFLSVLKHRNPDSIERLSLTQARRGVYAGAHKLATVGGRVEGLFNVADDPAETHDIAGSDSALAAQLQAEIDNFVRDAEARRVDGASVAGVSDEMMDNLRALGYVE